MKVKRSTLIPAILALYLLVMAYIGFDDYSAGRTSPLFYFGTIAITIVVLILLHFNLKHRERLRIERMRDLEEACKNNK